jgi:alginate O-acetyltransferase complex protein AlgI
MDLTSLRFIFLFLPIFLLVFLVASQRMRLPVVLAGSIIFLTLGQTTAIWWLSGILVASYALGRAISWSKTNGRSGIGWLWLGVGINVALLSLFKFTAAYGVAGLSWISVPHPWIVPISSLALPLGLSFVTFQGISYLVDVWRGRVPVEANFFSLAAYLLFFPKIVSGPLMRYEPFAVQLAELAPSWEEMAMGFRRLLMGFIKRTLIANQLALVANAAFGLPTPNLEPRFAWLALASFTLQIFFDFAGYTDMALGLGMMIGIRLPENFNYPYLAQSVSDFWRRWHITLATWFREYVFYPLERRRFKWAGQQINIVIVFLLTGLWHGFKPTFIIWGLLYGVTLALESAGFGRWLKRSWRLLRHLYTLGIVLIGWVFFRSNDLGFALGFFRRLAGDVSGLSLLPFSQTTPLPCVEPSFLLAAAAGIILCLPLSSAWNRFRADLQRRKPALFFAFQPAEDIALVALFVLGLAAIFSGAFTPNLYAKF